MSIDTIAPTPERQRQLNERLLAPTITQNKLRDAYRVVTYIETLHALGKLNAAEKMAADKFYRHWMGHLGHDVRTGDRADIELCEEESIVYHGQQVTRMKRAVPLGVQWRAIVDTIEEARTLEQIGRDWLKCKQRGQAYIAGLSLLKLGLRQIAEIYDYG